MAQYIDRMTQFSNAISNVTKALTGSKCTPFIEFYVGDLMVSTHNTSKLDYFMQMDLEYSGAGIGSANKFTISLAYVPQPNQDPNALDRALDGVTAEQRPCRLRYGYGGIQGFNLVSQEYECIVLGYNISLRDSIIYYTITGVSTAMSMREKRYNFPSFENRNPIDTVKMWFNYENTFKGKVVTNIVDKTNGDIGGFNGWNDYDIEVVDKASSYCENMSLDAVYDRTVFEYLESMLLNIQDKEDPSAVYWYSISDIKGKKTIYIHRTTHLPNSKEGVRVAFTFDWGGNHQRKTVSGLVKAFETEFKGELNIATSDNMIETRYGINSSGNDVQIDGLEELEVGDYMEQDNRFTTKKWAKPLEWAYNASIELEGIPADVPIGAVIEVNPMFYGQKHHTAGLYMVIGGRSNITSSGFTTNLNLFKLVVDVKTLTYAKLKTNAIKAITGFSNIMKSVEKKVETANNRAETTLTFSGMDKPYTPTYTPPEKEEKDTNAKKVIEGVADNAKKVSREVMRELLEEDEDDNHIIDPSSSYWRTL